MNATRTWFIETNGVRTSYTSWLEAKAAWGNTPSGVLCRGSGVLLDAK